MREYNKISEEKKKKIIRAWKEGLKVGQICERFGIERNNYWRIRAKYKKGGDKNDYQDGRV